MGILFLNLLGLEASIYFQSELKFVSVHRKKKLADHPLHFLADVIQPSLISF